MTVAPTDCLVEVWQKGHEIVYAISDNRQENTLSRAACRTPYAKRLVLRKLSFPFSVSVLAVARKANASVS